MMRSAQVAMIPVFQFGMFCDGDCSIFPGSDMILPAQCMPTGTSTRSLCAAHLDFSGKVAAFGNIVRTS